MCYGKDVWEKKERERERERENRIIRTKKGEEIKQETERASEM